MSHSPNEASHTGTFEVGPPQEIRGEKVQLVYTRVSDPATDADLRIHALRLAVDSERLVFHKNIDAEDYDPTGSVIDTARRFLGFLQDGAA